MYIHSTKETVITNNINTNSNTNSNSNTTTNNNHLFIIDHFCIALILHKKWTRCAFFTQSSCGHNQQADYSATFSFSACWVCSCFCINHRTMTWTTGSVTCILYVIILNLTSAYTRGLGTPTGSQHNIFDSSFSCAADGVRTRGISGHSVWSLTLYQLSHPVTPQHT